MVTMAICQSCSTLNTVYIRNSSGNVTVLANAGDAGGGIPRAGTTTIGIGQCNSQALLGSAAGINAACRTDIGDNGTGGGGCFGGFDIVVDVAVGTDYLAHVGGCNTS